jgi:hypothetical protein
LVAGITLFVVPTVVYGGITLLGMLTKGTAGLAPRGLALDDTQWALFRAGHAHAGAWVICSLVLQVWLDSATLPAKLTWLARISAPGRRWPSRAGFSASPSCWPSASYFTSEQQASSWLWS